MKEEEEFYWSLMSITTGVLLCYVDLVSFMDHHFADHSNGGMNHLFRDLIISCGTAIVSLICTVPFLVYPNWRLANKNDTRITKIYVVALFGITFALCWLYQAPSDPDDLDELEKLKAWIAFITVIIIIIDRIRRAN